MQGTDRRIDRSYIRRARYAFQWALFLFILYGGIELYLFERHFTQGGALVERPSLVDGFLPIGSLMSMKLWLATGIVDPVHPAGLVILGAALLVSLLLKKGFCGWICPIGTISEQTFRIGSTLMGRNLRMHRYLDYPLRGLKYLLLGFFLYIVILRMTPRDIAAFLAEPYWKVADIMMLHFFTRTSLTVMVVLAALVILSFAFRNFWCRYLCPYGALLGLVSMLSPIRITRDDNHCIHCKRCTRNCPSHLDVEGLASIGSPECMGCLTCVSKCPAPEAIDMRLMGRRRISPMQYGGLVAIVFFGVIWAAMLMGHWKSGVAYEEYKALVPIAETLSHP